MSKVVIILGAGASKQSGAPVMAEFLDVASDLLVSGKANGAEDHFKRVFTARSCLQQVHSKAQLDLNNVESIFTVLELGRILEKVPGLKRNEISETIESLKVMIVKTLEASMLFNIYQTPDGRAGSKVAPSHSYQRFVEKILKTDRRKGLDVSVITFNYDIGLDVAMYDAGIRPNYFVNPLQDNYTYESQVDMMKLHGSLNWGVDDQNQEIYAFDLRGLLDRSGKIPRGPVPITVGSDIQEHCKSSGRNVGSSPVIVPPSWNKADYHSMVSKVWAAAARNLSEAEYIYIIGYSLPLTDSFFRHLYALGTAGESWIRSIVVFNPDGSKQTKSRFSDLIGLGARDRYKYEKKTFEQCIDLISNRLDLA